MIDSLAVKQRIVLFVVVEDAKQPALMIFVHVLIHDLLAKSCHSYGVLESGLLSVFAHAVAENLLVELDGP